MRQISYHYDSIADFYAQPLHEGKTFIGWKSELAQNGQSDFIGQRWDYCQAHKYGDETAAERIRQLPDFAAVTAYKARAMSDIDGEDIDMERYLDGDERCFISRKKRIGKNARGVILLTINICEPGKITPDQMYWKAAAAVHVADSIEKNGNRCEIVVCSDAKTSDTEYRVSVTIKRADDPIDLSLLGAATSPWWFRSYTFLHQAGVWPDCPENFGSPIRERKEGLFIGTGECLSMTDCQRWFKANSIMQ